MFNKFINYFYYCVTKSWISRLLEICIPLLFLLPLVISKNYRLPIVQTAPSDNATKFISDGDWKYLSEKLEYGESHQITKWPFEYNLLNLKDYELLDRKIKREIAYCPSNARVEKIMNELKKQTRLPIVACKSSSEMIKYMAKENTFVGIEFNLIKETKDEITPINLNYTIRMPAKLWNNPYLVEHKYWQTYKITDEFSELRINDKFKDTDPYKNNGVCYIINAITQVIIVLEEKTGGIPTKSHFHLKKSEYVENVWLEDMEYYTPLIICLCFLYPILAIVKSIADEREDGRKDLIEIYGLSTITFWLSWLLSYLITMFITSIFLIIILKATIVKADDSILNSDIKIIEFTSFGILLIFFMTYVFMIIGLALLVAATFHRALLSVIVMIFVWILTLIPYQIIAAKYYDLKLWEKVICSFLPNSALGIGVHKIFASEVQGVGISFENINKNQFSNDITFLCLLLIMLLVGSVLILLAITIDIMRIKNRKSKIVHSNSKDAGKNKKPRTNRRKKLNAKLSKKSQKNNKKRSNVLEVIKVTLKTKQLILLHGLTMKAYPNQITVIYGVNGSGKTMAISSIAGLQSASGGKICRNGSVSYCTQEPILFENRSVMWNVYFFGILKGLKLNVIRKYFETYGRVFNLMSKRNTMACRLSIGLRKNLMATIAICGHSNYMFLDDPTSGMDSKSRQNLWTLLHKLKHGRVIVVATHSLDEVDALADQIVVLSNGVQKCYEPVSTLRMKSPFEYHLKCKCDNPELVRIFINNHFPNTKFDYNERIIDCQLNGCPRDLRKLLLDMQVNANQLKLNNVTFSKCSIQLVLKKMLAKISCQNVTITVLPTDSELRKKKKNIKKNEKLDEEDYDVSEPEYVGSMAESEVFYEDLIKVPEERCSYCVHQKERNPIVIKPLLQKIFSSYRLLLLAFILFIVFALFLLWLCTLIVARYYHRDESSQQKISFTMNDYMLENSVVLWNIQEKRNSILSNYYVQYYFEPNGTIKNFYAGDAIDKYNDTKFDNKFIFAKYVFNRLGSLQVESFGYWVHSVPITAVLFSNALLRSRLGNDYSVHVSFHPFTSNEYKERTSLLSGSDYTTPISYGELYIFLVALYLSLIAIILAATFVRYVARERWSFSKHLQFIGGAGVVKYWICHFIFDLFVYLCIITFLMLVFFILQLEFYYAFVDLFYLIVILMAFGFAAIPMAYMISSFNRSIINSFVILIVIGLIGIVMFLIVYLLRLPKGPVRTDKASDFHFWFIILPQFALPYALWSFSENVAVHDLCYKICDTIGTPCSEDDLCAIERDCCLTSYFSTMHRGVGTEILVMLIVGLILMFIVIFLEFRYLNEMILYLFRNCRKSKLIENDSQASNDSVAVEKKRVNDLETDDLKTEDYLVLQDVSKTSNEVYDISFGVNSYETLCIHGSNSCGKSTLLNLISKRQCVDRGFIYIRSFDVRQEVRNAYKFLGYCPQKDSTLDHLTGREILIIFSQLKGVTIGRALILAEDLKLTPYLNKQVKHYSTGTKTKLSVIIAFIGTPSVILLDDPTATQDNEGKESIWCLINKLRCCGKTFVICTHDINDSEEVATLTAIMKNGSFTSFEKTTNYEELSPTGFILKFKIADGDSVVEKEPGKIPKKNAMTLIWKEMLSEKFQHITFCGEYDKLLIVYIPSADASLSKVAKLVLSDDIEYFTIKETCINCNLIVPLLTIAPDRFKKEKKATRRKP